jgi:hypothetical protein
MISDGEEEKRVGRIGSFEGVQPTTNLLEKAQVSLKTVGV